MIKDEEASVFCPQDFFGYLNDQEPLEGQFLTFATQVTEKAQEVIKLIEKVVDAAKMRIQGLLACTQRQVCDLEHKL